MVAQGVLGASWRRMGVAGTSDALLTMHAVASMR